jgi:hypothetical protein
VLARHKCGRWDSERARSEGERARPRIKVLQKATIETEYSHNGAWMMASARPSRDLLVRAIDLFVGMRRRDSSAFAPNSAEASPRCVHACCGCHRVDCLGNPQNGSYSPMQVDIMEEGIPMQLSHSISPRVATVDSVDRAPPRQHREWGCVRADSHRPAGISKRLCRFQLCCWQRGYRVGWSPTRGWTMPRPASFSTGTETIEKLIINTGGGIRATAAAAAAAYDRGW